MADPKRSNGSLSESFDMEEMMEGLWTVEEKYPENILADFESDMSRPPTITSTLNSDDLLEDFVDDSINCFLESSHSFMVIMSFGIVMYSFGVLIYLTR